MTRRLLSILTLVALVVGSTAPGLAARPPGQVRGVLLDSEGLPAAGYQLALKGAEGDLFVASPSGQDGAFEVSGLPAGEYSLVAYSPDGAEFRIVDGDVSLEPGQVLRLELRLIDGPLPPGRDPEAMLADPTGDGGWLSRVWNSGAGGKTGVIVVASALAYGLVALFDDDDEEETIGDDVSPTSP